MSAQAASTNSKFDALKWLIAIALIIGGIVAFNIYSEQPLWIRVVGILISVVAALATMLSTATGKSVWQFARESRTELRKVIWPTSSETVRTTIAVLVMVIVLGFFLWALDWAIVKILGLITG